MSREPRRGSPLWVPSRVLPLSLLPSAPHTKATPRRGELHSSAPSLLIPPSRIRSRYIPHPQEPNTMTYLTLVLLIFWLASIVIAHYDPY